MEGNGIMLVVTMTERYQSSTLLSQHAEDGRGNRKKV
jgi:hypothetical protein